jgi:hypothetical protein
MIVFLSVNGKLVWFLLEGWRSEGYTYEFQSEETQEA